MWEQSGTRDGVNTRARWQLLLELVRVLRGVGDARLATLATVAGTSNGITGSRGC
jgi:hypothetical protein